LRFVKRKGLHIFLNGSTSGNDRYGGGSDNHGDTQAEPSIFMATQMVEIYTAGLIDRLRKSASIFIL